MKRFRTLLLAVAGFALPTPGLQAEQQTGESLVIDAASHAMAVAGVTSGDPYRLCPRRYREGTECRGGLSIEQWSRVEYAVHNHMHRGDRRYTLNLLRSGNIRPTGGDRVLRSVDAGGVFRDQPGTMYINTSFDGAIFAGRQTHSGSMFDSPSIFLAETLLHEGKHIRDVAALSEEERDVVFTEGTPENRRFEREAEDYATRSVVPLQRFAERSPYPESYAFTC
jgi:hypothetical protein